MSDFSDYVVYVDETGDHGMASIDPSFPMFGLAFCVFEIESYLASVVPSVQRLKFDFFGHDMVVLHEREIRKRTGAFTFLLVDPNRRADFLEQLNQLVDAAPTEVIAGVVNKNRLSLGTLFPDSPYHLALRYCLGELANHMANKGQSGRIVHVVFESRGSDEDRDLELCFRRWVDERQTSGAQKPSFERNLFRPVFARKAVNSAGLQLADLFARPLALSVLRPDQSNRALDTIRRKLLAFKELV